MNPSWSEMLETAWTGARTGRLDSAGLGGLSSVEEAERLQLDVLGRWREAGERRAGWKIGMTSGENRDALGPGIRPFGFILESRVLRSGATVRLDAMGPAGIETELCFRVGSPLAGQDTDAAAARDAVGGVLPAFEINEDRITGPQGAPIRVADNLRQWGIVVGEEIPLPGPDFDWDGILVGLSRDGGSTEIVAAKGHIDDHFVSLAALARELSRFGLGLEPDDLVITGAYGRLRVTGPGRFTGSFSGIGDLSVDFA